jgi:GTPase SAR1 family protein
MSGKAKKVFPGGNTTEGFYSFYSYMIESSANRFFILKGGSGVGKSSMMKKIGHALLDMGYDVEFHHCSSDPGSLDGIVVPKLGVAMVDGTAPHIIDPKTPGAFDEIVNLGDFLNTEKLEGIKQSVLDCSKEVGRLFARAYKYLAACAPIVRSIEDKYKNSMDFGSINLLTLNLTEEIFKGIKPTGDLSKERHLFGSSLTPIGHVEFTDTILDNIKNVYYLNGEVGTGKSTLMTKIYKKALELGLNVEVYHAPLLPPEKIETIVIEELGIAITTSKLFKEKNYKSIDLNEYICRDKIDKYLDEIQYDKKVLDELLNYGLFNLKKAKEQHDVLEKYYVPSMDFSENEKVKKSILNKMLSYAKK